MAHPPMRLDYSCLPTRQRLVWDRIGTSLTISQRPFRTYLPAAMGIASGIMAIWIEAVWFMNRIRAGDISPADGTFIVIMVCIGTIAVNVTFLVFGILAILEIAESVFSPRIRVDRMGLSLQVPWSRSIRRKRYQLGECLFWVKYHLGISGPRFGTLMFRDRALNRVVAVFRKYPAAELEAIVHEVQTTMGSEGDSGSI
jgi:hypothetical protein